MWEFALQLCGQISAGSTALLVLSLASSTPSLSELYPSAATRLDQLELIEIFIR
jgi:hypothetical protein